MLPVLFQIVSKGVFPTGSVQYNYLMYQIMKLFHLAQQVVIAANGQGLDQSKVLVKKKKTLFAN